MDPSLEFLATIGHLMTGFGTILLSILLYKSFRHLETATKATEIQTEFKFRPWVGPTGLIREIGQESGKKRFEITIKNFGDLPANEVLVSSIVKNQKITKEELQSQKTTRISLGPVLPNMEKRYWLDVENSILEQAKKQGGKISTGVLFEYPLSFGRSEYGLISEIDPDSFKFVHTDMWVASPELKTK